LLGGNGGELDEPKGSLDYYALIGQKIKVLLTNGTTCCVRRTGANMQKTVVKKHRHLEHVRERNKERQDQKTVPGKNPSRGH